MSIVGELIGRHMERLSGFPGPVQQHFEAGLRALSPRLSPSQLQTWADLGRRLYKGNWKSSSLAAQFYDLATPIFSVVRIGQANRLVLFVDELARHSYELASACLANAPEVLSRLDEDDRLPFLAFA